MAQEERFGTRDGSYSAWHRRNSTRRYVGIEAAQLLAMIDLDGAIFVEYDDGSKEPLALVETALDCGQAVKPATVLKNLARRCVPEIAAYVVLYSVSNRPNPADEKQLDIEAFRVRRVWPEPEKPWQTFTPQEYAKKLLELRQWSARKFDWLEDDPLGGQP